jgi:predicted PurR-regulated permease PerM
MPQYQQLLVSAQARDLAGNFLNPQAVQQVQLIDQIVQQHIQAHQQTLQQEQENIGAPSAPSGQAMTTLRSQVQSNAQNISNQVAADTAETIDAA